MEIDAVLAAGNSWITLKSFNWSTTKTSRTTVQQKDQTTLVCQPFKAVMPFYFVGLLPLVGVIRGLMEWALEST